MCRSRSLTRAFSAVLGLWVALLWGGPLAALRFCPMHEGSGHRMVSMAAMEHQQAASTARSDATSPETPASPATQQLCTCLWCATGSGLAVQAPEIPVAVQSATAVESPRPVVSRASSPLWYRLPFAIGPPRA